VDAYLSLTENHRDTAQGNNAVHLEVDMLSIDRPSGTLLHVDAIDSKNTMQSFDFVEENNEAKVFGVARYTNSRNVRAPVNQPTLRSGQVIDCKNTMQSHEILGHNNMTSQRSVIFNNVTTGPPNTTTKHHQNGAAESIQPVAMGEIQAFAVENVSAVAIVEGKLFTERPRLNRTLWGVLGTLAVVTAIVITGVCSAGKCSAKNRDPQLIAIPTMSPTVMISDDQVEHAILSFVNQISFLQEEIPLNGKSPESRALAWLIREDPLFTVNKSSLLLLDSKNETALSFRVRQRYALATLWFQQIDKNGDVSAPWDSFSDWLKSSDECGWFGIACSEQHAIVEIDFYIDDRKQSNNYSGTIPPDIGQLTSLTSLDFKSNMVTGSLPESIGQCSQLQVFDVLDGSMTGTFPSSMRKLTAMEYFDVSSNVFSGMLPPITEQWLNLKHFHLGRNRLNENRCMDSLNVSRSSQQ
jgi:hypothetical protein